MNDQRIHKLLAQAHELDAFEDDLRAGASPLFLAEPVAADPVAADRAGLRLVGASSGMHSRGGGSRPRWLPVLLGLSGLAAAVAVAVVTLQPTQPMPPAPIHVVMGSGSKSATETKPLPDYVIEFLKAVQEASQRPENKDVLLAVYEPAAAESPARAFDDSCLQVWTPAWAGQRNIADAREAELVGESLDHACLDRPGRVTIVGLSGPVDELPQTQAQAHELVACMMLGRSDPTHACGTDDWSLRSAATQCVPDNVAVRVETISLKR